MPHPRQFAEKGASRYHYTSTNSTSGSWTSVAEKRTLKAPYVRTV
jgi:hypothetical protein